MTKAELMISMSMKSMKTTKTSCSSTSRTTGSPTSPGSRANRDRIPTDVLKDELGTDLQSRVRRKLEERLRRELDQKDEKVRLRKAAAERKVEIEKIEQLAAEKTLQLKADQDQQRRLKSPMYATRSRVRTASRPHKETNFDHQQKMKGHADAYEAQLQAMQDKIDSRRPLYGVDRATDDRKAAQAKLLQKKRDERLRQQAREELQRWEVLRSAQKKASQRPLLIDDTSHAKSESNLALTSHTLHYGHEKYESDARIKAAISQRSFSESAWGKQVKQIKENTRRRGKVHEMQCAAKRSAHDSELCRTIMCNGFG